MVTVSRKYAKLNKDDLNKVQALEKELGKVLLVYEDPAESVFAPLSEAQVEKIRRLEQELGVVLLAYKP